MFSSCSAVGHGTNAKFDSGYFPEEGSYVLNCKGVSNLAAACKTNLIDTEKITNLVLRYIDNTNIKGISKFKNLKKLIIADSNLADQDITFLRKSIDSLTLYSCKNVDYTQIPNTVSILSLHHCLDIDLDVISKLDNITSLSLTYSDIAHPSKLCLLKQISTLEIIGDMGYTDRLLNMSYISDLNNLTTLRIYSLDSENFNAISNLGQLEELTYTNSWNITHEALSALSKLKIFDTVDHFYINYSFKDCNSLPYSEFPYNYSFNKRKMNIDDNFILAVENMPELQILRCKGYPHSKIKACKNLKEAMFVCDYVDLNDLNSLDDLEKLRIVSSNIIPSKTNMNVKELECCDIETDLSFLDNFPALEKLRIKYNNIPEVAADMSYICKCTELKSLSVVKDYDSSKNEAFNVSFISALNDLEELYLMNITIDDIEPISKLINLKTLILKNNCLCDIKSLSYLKSLQYVDLSDNMISDISPLKDLDCISYLNLSNNEISQLPMLFNLKNVANLDISYNRIEDISAVSSLKNIKCLDICHNQIKSINALENLPNIERLNLSYNRISDLTPISCKDKLKYLDISNNDINCSNLIYDLNSLEELRAFRLMTTDLDFIYGFPSILDVWITYSYETVDIDQLNIMKADYEDSIPMCRVYIGRDESDIVPIY